MKPTNWARRVAGPIAVAALAFAGLSVAAPAQADTAPVDPTTEPTTAGEARTDVHVSSVVHSTAPVVASKATRGRYTALANTRPSATAAGLR